MFKHFLKITLRSLSKRGMFSIINILGLSIGLAVVLLMYLQIQHELSFDKSFKESKNIYRVNAEWFLYRTGETTALTPAGLAQVMKETIPGVEAAVRIFHRAHILKVGEFEEDTGIHWSDEGFFRLFDTPIIYGSTDEMWERPDALALSEKTAKKMFGNRNPVGETVLFGPSLMQICAVYKDFPINSSFSRFLIIGSINNRPMYNDPRAKNLVDFETFCLLHEKTDTANVGKQLRHIASNDFKDQGYTLSLQKLTKIHLHSSHIFRSRTSSPGDIEKVKMLALLAAIILLIACINYMNLATARAQKRSREIGISKTIGAKRIELAVQLFLETGILTTFSFILAFGLAYMLLPVSNNLMNEHLHFGLALNVKFLLGALTILILTTIIAASYPVFYMSGFPPLDAIRSGAFKGSKNAFVRQALIISQFVAAIVLITWVITVYTQIRYINNKDVGYNLNNVISFWIRTNPGPDFTPFENAIRAQSSIEQISRVSFFPTIGDQVLLRRDIDDTGTTMTVCNADEHLIDLAQLRLIAGNPLPARLPGDTIAQIVLNRKAVEYLGSTPEDIVGKRIYVELGERWVNVCGVVEDFNFESLHRPISEYGIHNSRFGRGRFYLMARISGHDIPGQLERYGKIFKDFYPNDMFDVHYPDLEMKSKYQGIQTTSHISLIFSILAIFVACMGVFGLTAFMAELRTKEIGIRKVMGASVWDIVKLFTNNYVKLLCISLVIAFPAAWWVGERYLQNFAYRISLSWWMFAVAALITVALTLLTVGVLAIKAAIANPVESLKTE